MNKAREQEKTGTFFLLRSRSKHPSSSLSAPARQARGRLVNRLAALLALALLLFAARGILIGMAGASALIPAQAWSDGPTRGHPPTPSPTPSTVPSPTASVTPAPTSSAVPSPTASATPAPAPSPTLTTIPAGKATVPVTATPAVTATLSSLTGQAVAGPGRTPGATPPTGSTLNPAALSQGQSALLLLALGMGLAGLLLLAVGLALRLGLRPARKRTLAPGGTVPWQRVRAALPGTGATLVETSQIGSTPSRRPATTTQGTQSTPHGHWSGVTIRERARERENTQSTRPHSLVQTQESACGKSEARR